MATVVFGADLAFAKKGDSSSKKKIELCCAWGNALDDGALTFSINKGGSDLAKIVKLAINDWEKALGGIEFKYVKVLGQVTDSPPITIVKFFSFCYTVWNHVLGGVPVRKTFIHDVCAFRHLVLY